jgi:23S rRNA (cytosine1962-C5)-methyltransferase
MNSESEKSHFPPTIQLLASSEWQDYALLDSGNGERLEKFGTIKLVRPDAEAIWKTALPPGDWQKVQARFKTSAEEMGGHWEKEASLPESWVLEYKNLRFRCQLSASKQVGIFPEQAVQWDWIAQQVKQANRPLKVLNLFGYTGLASLAAASAGAKVTHLDASKKVILWAKDNQALSKISLNSIRWIVDDALKFVQREARRGSRYDGIILDPPKFGRGPKGEVWEFYKVISELLDSIRQVLSPNPAFIVLTAYAVKASAITLEQALSEIMKPFHGVSECGEVVLKDKSAGRLLSTSIFARWNNIGSIYDPDRQTDSH